MAVIADVRNVDLADVILAVADGKVQLALDQAEPHVHIDFFDTTYDLAHALFAAHLLYATLSAAGGEISSATAGGISASFAVPTSVEAVRSTSFGRRFLELRDSRVNRIP